MSDSAREQHRLIYTLIQPETPGPIDACCGDALATYKYEFTKSVEHLLDLLEARCYGRRVYIRHGHFLTTSQLNELRKTASLVELAEVETAFATTLSPDQLFKLLVMVDAIPTAKSQPVHARNARRWPRKAVS